MSGQRHRLQIENISTPRPMTHDLLRNVIHDLKATVRKIVVCDLQDNTFYARSSTSRRRRDAGHRCAPSDAIALALQTRAPIFVEETVIDPRQDGGLRREERRGSAAQVAGEPRSRTIGIRCKCPVGSQQSPVAVTSRQSAGRDSGATEL
jgi:bifunctional DNase/RNase